MHVAKLNVVSAAVVSALPRSYRVAANINDVEDVEPRE